MRLIGLAFHKVSKTGEKWFLSQDIRDKLGWVNFPFQEELALTLRKRNSKLLEANNVNSLIYLQIVANSAVTSEDKIISTYLFDIVKYL